MAILSRLWSCWNRSKGAAGKFSPISSTPLEHPTLRVNLGKVQPIENGLPSSDSNLRYIHYEEGLGPFGFGIF